jgi:3',5'-cyclic AMP phosphodiesterase CpdA
MASLNTFIQFTDLHLSQDERSQRAFQKLIDEVNDLSPQPGFAIHTGDICLQAGMGELYQKLCEGFEIPLFDGLGNHDLLVGESDPKAQYRKLTGRENYYSFDCGNAHFIVMDSLACWPEEQGWHNVVGEVGEVELKWLQSDLEAAGPDVPIVAFCHIPLFSTYPERRGFDANQVPAWKVTNADEIHEMFTHYSVKAVLAGHFHENENILKDGIEYICTGAVCGSWWDWDRWPHNPDGVPKGYRIATLDNTGSFRSRYKSLGESIDHRMSIMFEPDNRHGRFKTLKVNVFDGSERWDVKCQANDEEWNDMTCLTIGVTADVDDIKGEHPDDLPKLCTHLWEADIDTIRYPSDQTEWKVRATDPHGRIALEIGVYKRISKRRLRV